MIDILYKTYLMVFLLTIVTSPAYSTLIIPPDNMQQMIEDCDIIVYGTVLSHADDSGRINDFKIMKSFKGDLKKDEIIKLREHGHRTETSVVSVNGDVDFKIGSNYLIFLFQDGAAYYRPQLLSLSVYEELFINDRPEFIHTASLLDICFLDDLDESLIGSYDSQDMLSLIHI